MEIWKNIEGYEGRYMISNYGRVKSFIGHEKILTPRINTKGYYSVQLSKNKKAKSFLIHRLVAIAFIDNPKGLPYINHKDEDRTNNHVSNLEWCDEKYNLNYGSVTQRLSQINKSSRVENVPKRVQATFPDNSIIEYNSIKEASRECHVSPNEIRRVVDKNNLSAKGIRFHLVKNA